MKYRYLLTAGRKHLANHPAYTPVSGPGSIFPRGARWMYDRLNELDGDVLRPFPSEMEFNGYGCLKYGICLSGAVLAGWWSLRFGILFIPLSFAAFYLLEVQFLFLFPLLIDRVRRPILTGVRQVFKIGLLRCLLTVIPISVFMMMGVFRKKNPVLNWHIGCLAILIWYKNEVRNRI